MPILPPRSGLFHALARLKGDCANTAITFALAFLPMVGFLGLAVDGGRVFMVKSQLSSATDVAALSATKLFDNNQRNKKAEEFFLSNFGAEDFGVEVKDIKFEAEEVGGVKRVDVTSTVKMKTLFMSFFGTEEVEVSAYSRAEKVDTAIEVALALDNTGSMALSAGGGSRISALKSAVNIMVDTLYGTKSQNDQLRFAIVPYTAYVNVGHLLDPQFLEGIPGYSNKSATDPLGWKGCVDADETNNTIDGSTSMTSGLWSTAFDTMDMKPGRRVKASLFPTFWQYYDYLRPAGSDPGETCAGFVPVTTTVTDNNPTFTEQHCVEATCTTVTRVNPNFGMTSTHTTSCTPRAATSWAAFTSVEYIWGHPYNAGGNPLLYGRNTPPDPAMAWTSDPSASNLRYLYDASWKPAITYASRSTDRSSQNPNLVAPTADNFDDAGQGIRDDVDNLSAASPNTYCPEQAMPLMAHQKAAIKSYVNTSLKPFFPDWGTMSNLGLLWSWRMLSPALPFKGEPKKSGSTKAIVLMTDGQLWHPGGGDRGMQWHDAVRTAYGFGSEKTLANNPNATNAQLVEAIRQRLRKTCANIKRDGITIYTVTFDPAMSSAEKDLYRNCASTASLYYDAPDATALKSAFEAIADDLTGVRLAK
jgi:Flp pilus assembly protein TadG